MHKIRLSNFSDLILVSKLVFATTNYHYCHININHLYAFLSLTVYTEEIIEESRYQDQLMFSFLYYK